MHKTIPREASTMAVDWIRRFTRIALLFRIQSEAFAFPFPFRFVFSVPFTVDRNRGEGVFV